MFERIPKIKMPDLKLFVGKCCAFMDFTREFPHIFVGYSTSFSQPTFNPFISKLGFVLYAVLYSL